MKPSEVSLSSSFPPLAGTFGRSEREAAATLLVRSCQVNGDIFAPKTPRVVGDALKKDREAGVEPLASLSRNPFWRPDFRDLVVQGFARWTREGEGAPIEFTEKGLEALKKHAPGGEYR